MASASPSTAKKKACSINSSKLLFLQTNISYHEHILAIALPEIKGSRLGIIKLILNLLVEIVHLSLSHSTCATTNAPEIEQHIATISKSV